MRRIGEFDLEFMMLLARREQPGAKREHPALGRTSCEILVLRISLRIRHPTHRYPLAAKLIFTTLWRYYIMTGSDAFKVQLAGRVPF